MDLVSGFRVFRCCLCEVFYKFSRALWRLRCQMDFSKELARMPSSTLIPFLGGSGSLINPLKQKRAPFLSLGYWAA